MRSWDKNLYCPACDLVFCRVWLAQIANDQHYGDAMRARAGPVQSRGFNPEEISVPAYVMTLRVDYYPGKGSHDFGPNGRAGGVDETSKSRHSKRREARSVARRSSGGADS